MIISGIPYTVYVDNLHFYSTTTGVAENVAPDIFALKQTLSNPFNPSTTIGYSLVEPIAVLHLSWCNR